MVVSTPDHWHGIITAWALDAGKHVYCEKPLARTVWECRKVAELAKEKKLVTQMGTQIHAGSNYRRVVELVKSGAIGRVWKVDVWCEKRPDPGKRPAQGAPIPTTLDYDLWVGPAEYRPYDPKVVPFNWRWWWEFGGGVLGDMGCHYMDLAHWALDLRAPDRIKATGTQFPDADNKVPVELRVDYHYPARGSLSEVRLVWWHGTTGPRSESGQPVDYGMRSGVLFQGDEGQLVADYGSHKLLPESKYGGFQRPSPTIPESIGHHNEWIQAIKTGSPTTCNFDYSGALTEAVQLGNVAYRVGHEIEWDAAKFKVRNVKGAEEYLKPRYRGSWKLRP